MKNEKESDEILHIKKRERVVLMHSLLSERGGISLMRLCTQKRECVVLTHSLFCRKEATFRL